MKKHFIKIKNQVSRGRFFVLAAVLAVTATLGSLPIVKPVHAAVGSVTEYTLPVSGSILNDIGIGPDNNIWYTGYGPATNTRVGKLTTSGVFTEYPNRTSGSKYPRAITKGSDGNLWYSEQYNVGSTAYYRIVNLTTTGTVLGKYDISKNANSITLGPDGNVWFTSGTNGIGKITTSGTVTEYTVTAGGNINSITVGPDGNLWFTVGLTGSTAGNSVGKITTSGSYTIYPLSIYNAYPTEIVTGPDGNLWFTEYYRSKIGKITTSGTVTEYTTLATGQGIAAGSDGALWFSQPDFSKIGRITTSGALTYYDTPGATPGRVITGPDGAVWFTNGTAQIGRMATELTHQTVSFTSTAPTNATLDSSPYVPTASATSGLPVAITVDASSSSVCSIDGSGNVTYQAAGTCTLNANQGGNIDYAAAAQVQQSFTVLPVNADTSVALSCPSTALVGTSVTCTITVTNNGPAAAQNASLTALFANSFTSVSVSGGTLSGQTVTWSTPSLASGDSATITVTGTATTPGKARFNAALLQTSPDPNISNNIVASTVVIS